MNDSETIVQLIYRSLDDINAELPQERQLARSPETSLYGPQSVLDSLQLVRLIVAVEAEIEQACGVAVALASDRAFSRQRSPFLTVGSLAAYIDELVRAAPAAPGV
jgi:acyl carrier protein